jgi:hypothetical protein
MANHAPKASVTGNSSSAVPQPFRDPNAMDINASIISELTNLSSSVSTVSDIRVVETRLDINTKEQPRKLTTR